MSIAAIRSHRGDEYQVCIALHWLIHLLSEEDIEWVQVESIVLPTQNELVKASVAWIPLRFIQATFYQG